MWQAVVASGAGIVAMTTASVAMAAPKPADVQVLVQAALDKSASGWNAGDVDLFMGCYEDAPTTSYVSNGKVTEGFQAIRSAYATRFAAGAKAMGHLSLAVVQLRIVGNDHAYVIGRFTLTRAAADGGDVTGVTTLLFRKTSAGWRIIADHS